MASVEFNNVTKQFDADTVTGTRALSSFNLSIDEGEFVVLIGPSGCGKSTALRLLAGLESVTEGDILIDGRVVNQQTPQQRNIAMVFQNYALYPHMNVQDNLAFPLKMAHLTKGLIAQKVEEIANILDLTALLDRKPKQLSGGQRQRVAMGRALVRDPRVFLLDEPLSNLDANLRTRIRGDIKKIQRRLKKTTLYVTHDQVEAMTLGDRVAVMYEGNLQQFSTPDELYQKPVNVFVARFIGNPGMNILDATLQHDDASGLQLQLTSRSVTLPTPGLQVSDTVIKQTASIGIRPEAFHVIRQEGDVAIDIDVETMEYIGSESLIHFKIGDNYLPEKTLTAKLTGSLPENKMHIDTLYINLASLYFFNKHGSALK